MKGKLYSVGQVAQWFQVSTKTIALWEQKGKFPSGVRSPGGHRRFAGSVIFAELKKYGYVIPKELEGAESSDAVVPGEPEASSTAKYPDAHRSVLEQLGPENT